MNDEKPLKKTKEIERTYKKKITFKCPVRGVVSQEVLVTVYKSPAPPENVFVDPEISILLGEDSPTDLEDLGFHEVEDN